MFGLRVCSRRGVSLWTLSLALSRAASSSTSAHAAASFKVDKSQLKERLTAEQYHVTQEKGTERPFTGVYDKHTEPGTYRCIVCNEVLFASESKYNSGCGWPAFSDVLEQSKVTSTPDNSIFGRPRIEVTCTNCGAHLGHVFDDGPKPTGKRYCINSCSINFEGKK